MPFIGLLALAALAKQDAIQAVKLALIPSGMTSHMGGYSAIELPLSTKKPGGIIRVPAGITAPLFATLTLGGSRFFVALATIGKTQRLFVDANSDGDLSNDPPAFWRTKVGQNASGSAAVRLPYRDKRAACNLIFVQVRPKMLNVIVDYGFAGHLLLGGRSVPFYLVDGATKGFPGGKPDGSVLGIDRKGNSLISGPAEQYSGELPFTVDGTSLVLTSIDPRLAVATFSPGEKVAEIPLPRKLAANTPSPVFVTQDLAGKPINFPADYGGKVILLYAWASWSKPSLEWLPKIANANDSFKQFGLSVLGLCLNRAGELDDVKSAAAQMPWTTAFDGKSWGSDVVRQLSINTLPFVLLVDGKSGKIIATMDDLVGEKFDSVIRASVVGRS